MTKFTGSITYRCALSSTSTLFIATGTSYLIAKLQNLFAVWLQVDHKLKIRYIDAHKYLQMRPAGDSQVACKWLTDVHKYIKSCRWLAGVLTGVSQVSCISSVTPNFIPFGKWLREESHNFSIMKISAWSHLSIITMAFVSKLSKLWHEIVKFNLDFPRDFSNICINTWFQMNQKKFNKHHLYTHKVILSPYMMSMVSLSCIYFLYPSEFERERIN